MDEIVDGITAKAAMGALKKALRADPEYAWSWHCNIAMAALDEGLEHKKANQAAARFMRNAFDIDTTKNEHYAQTVEG